LTTWAVVPERAGVLSRQRRHKMPRTATLAAAQSIAWQRMKPGSSAGLYLLLIVLATVSMVYYVAGALALREEFFHPGR
jgi:hypothetical protein